MRHEEVQTDITVIGGGLAGVCAAVAAARLGQTVALIQNRPVLGGNSSSEVRVWVCGATAHGQNRYARETGIMGEMFVENQFRNPDGNPYYWDLVVLETVQREKNIQLFLNTDVHEVEAVGEEQNRKITSVTGWMMASERQIRFESSMYLDCTGDGLVGFMAGAEYRIGREAKHEYNEDWAPEVSDDITLGSTLLFYTKDAGHPVKFVPPTFARDITQTTIPLRRVIRSGDNGCAYWWIEWGGEHDIVHDNERVRDELWAVIYGVWDYIKNSSNFDADHMTLEWVGSVPGKREYRRFIGDYVLNQNDILAQEPFDDRIAFGGWSIDLHPPQGVYAEESGSKHLYADGIYHIPFRSLYSVNVSNLMFAGRDISASHVAFGTTRVMATCAVIGEATGSGAALSIQKSVTPRELHANYMDELQQVMLRQDASIIGLANKDDRDLARTAQISASSSLQRIGVKSTDLKHRLTEDIGFIIPVDPKVEFIDLLVDADVNSSLQVELWDTGRKENYVPIREQLSTVVSIEAGEKQWVRASLPWSPVEVQNAFIIVRANKNISLYTSDVPHSGVLTFEKRAKHLASKDLEDHNDEQLLILWSMRNWIRKCVVFRTLPASEAYAPSKVTDGYSRPYGGPNMWVSESILDGSEEWLELAWDKEVSIAQIHLTFNDDVNEDLINLHHHRTPFEIIPELVKDYRVEQWTGSQWCTIATGKNNRRRKVVHRLKQSICTDKLRVVIESTNGSSHAEIVEVRCYSSPE